jgi:hypothetical protein
MNIYDQLYELHSELSQDEMWRTVLENAYDEVGANDLEELVEKATEDENEGLLYDLIDEGEYILSLKTQSLDEWYDEDEDDY